MFIQCAIIKTLYCKLGKSWGSTVQVNGDDLWDWLRYICTEPITINNLALCLSMMTIKCIVSLASA